VGTSQGGYDFAQKLIDAGIIPEGLSVRRLVIDVQMDEPVTVFYETYGDEISLDICIEGIMASNGLEVKQVEITN